MPSPAVAYRAANYGSPFRVEPSRRPGRFHELGDPPTQYACLHPLGPLAEMIRNEELSEAAELGDLRVRTWAIRLDLDGLLEIEFDHAEALGIDPGDLVSDDHSHCRRLAALQRASGTKGLIVPSAALPGTRGVVLFGERIATGYFDDPVDEVEIPASLTADPARSPASLFALVRRHGMHHVAYRRWRQKKTYSFVEPDWVYGR